MDKKISELDQALQINNDAVFPMSQDNSGTNTTYKASITQISTEIGEGQTFSNLQTTNKSLVGAINEINQGGGGGGSSNANLAPDYDSTSTYAVGDWCIYNSTLYQCNTAIPTAEAFDPTHWTAKKVVDELDDKVDTSDFLATNLPIQSGSATNTKDYIDTGLSGKADTSDTYTKSEVDTLLSGKAKVEVISLSFTSSNDGLYVVPTNYIPLTKYPVFAYEDTETANYYFTINNYRNTNWLVWCRNAQDLSLATNKAFTVRFVCVS